MKSCPACGNQMHEAAAACPSCGRPNTLPGSTIENTSWFGFRGRISRKEYWLHYALPLCVVPIFGAVIDGAAKANGVVSLIIALILLVPSLAGAVKRVHDRDRSGWFLLIWLIPLIGSIWMVVELGFLRGTNGPNRFGRDPLPSVMPSGVGRALS